MHASNFDIFLRPTSVAIVGASPLRGSPRNTLLLNLRKHGFGGRIYPVSRSSKEIEGLATFETVAELPETPDVALVITPAETVPGVIKECGVKGIRNAIVFSSGFEEVTGGAEIARRLANVACEHDIAVLGPNCQGVWSIRQKAMLTFSPAVFNRDTVLHAPIGIVSQSGALAGAIANSLLTSGMGCSYVVTVGNETCLDAIDALGSVIQQDDVRAIVLYIEGLNDAARILPLAQQARERDIQIVALKSGRTAFGQRTTASHTGKIASSHAVYSDLFEQAGIITVYSLQELVAAVEVFAYQPHLCVSHDAQGGAAVMSSSGGAAALLADMSSDFAVPMATFSQSTTARLEELLPSFAHKANPIDLTGQVNTQRDLFRNTCEAVVADQRTEAVVVQFSSSGRRYMLENGDVFKEMARTMPVLVSFIGEMMEPDVQREYREAGVLLSPDPAVTMRALSWLYRRENFASLPRWTERKPLLRRDGPRDWATTMQLLEQSGLTPARWALLHPGDEASVACAALHYPLVVKALPEDVEHKTEQGFVKLRVQTSEDVDAHVADFRSRLSKPGAIILVQEMVNDGVEVVLACLRNTDFGPVMSIGSGGVGIELYRDVTWLALPTTEKQVLLALSKLKLWALLQGFRGGPPTDVRALVAAAVRLGDSFLEMPDLQELEINPVIVHEEGKGVSAVDVLAILVPAGV